METTRAKVIEKAVGFEELISQLLSMLLDIDKNSSKSFGNQSSTLSFNAKINLLIDLKFITTEVGKDFVLFAEIRNKFAHALNVDTFVKCFEIIHDSRNRFLKKMSDEISKIDQNDESVYASCFEILCFELGIWLRETLKMISDKKSQDLNKIGAIEMIRSFVQYDSSKREKEYKHFIETIQPVIAKIIPDEKFLEEYKRLLKDAEEK
ncbi:hypothetical protein [Flavobacterium bernardetii]|uniref:Transcriptional regulator n=1 Tax=Flavobacterium bernardetii TaxID=2813823 RepID=A0ABR7J2L6_9FLAO|nr:hypothetical protein [Flavobacterium bernardetii]MBC5836270.1 hypothetical protein [Flavobacterium bernardetii]